MFGFMMTNAGLQPLAHVGGELVIDCEVSDSQTEVPGITSWVRSINCEAIGVSISSFVGGVVEDGTGRDW